MEWLKILMYKKKLSILNHNPDSCLFLLGEVCFETSLFGLKSGMNKLEQ